MIVWMYRYCQSKAAQFLVPALLSALPAPTSAPRLKPHSCSMLLAIATGFATNHEDNSPNKTSPTENHLKLPVPMQVSYIIVTRTNVFLLMCIDIDIFSTCLIITLSYHSFQPSVRYSHILPTIPRNSDFADLCSDPLLCCLHDN